MKILLAYPKFPTETFWSFESALAVSGRRSTMPPLGLLVIAGMLPAEQFVQTLADENVRPIRDQEIAEADVVLASAMVAQLESMERLLERCQRLGTPVIVGGPLVSGCFNELRARGWEPRTWFVGEAERLFPELLDDLLEGRLRRVYAHVADEERAGDVRTAFGPDARILVEALPALDLAPVPRFDLLDMRNYHSMAIQASRGCPIGCEFCDIWTQFGLKSRRSGSEHLLEQLDYLLALGWRGRIFVVDDNFIGNVGAARDLLPKLAAWQRSEKAFRVPAPYRGAIGERELRRLERRFPRRSDQRQVFSFSTEADVRLGDDAPKMTAIRHAMVEAGFNSVFLGIETPDADSLREAGKLVNIDKEQSAEEGLLRRVRAIQVAGLEVMSGFIIGFDNDSSDIDRLMIDFIERSGIPMAMVGLLGVLPGTKLQERLEREGRYRRKLTGTQTHEFALNFEPRGRSEQRVLDQYARVLEAVYGDRMRPYYRRCDRTMENLPGPPHTGDRLGCRELRAFALSFLRVRPRLPYWSFLLRTLVRRPRFLGFAVVLALQGEHLHRLTCKALEKFHQRTLDAQATSLESTSSESSIRVFN